MLCVTLPVTQHHRQDTLVNPRVCGWVALCLSLLIACKVPSCTKDARTCVWRLYVGTRSTSTCSVSCIGFVFSNRVLSSVCEAWSTVLAAAYAVLGFQWDPLWSTAQLDISQFYYWKLCLCLLPSFYLEVMSIVDVKVCFFGYSRKTNSVCTSILLACFFLLGNWDTDVERSPWVVFIVSYDIVVVCVHFPSFDLLVCADLFLVGFFVGCDLPL